MLFMSVFLFLFNQTSSYKIKNILLGMLFIRLICTRSIGNQLYYTNNLDV